MYRVLEHAASQVYPGATVLPSMMAAATDMAQLRAKGVHAYGIGPAMTGVDFAQHAWHSDVERLRKTLSTSSSSSCGPLSLTRSRENRGRSQGPRLASECRPGGRTGRITSRKRQVARRPHSAGARS